MIKRKNDGFGIETLNKHDISTTVTISEIILINNLTAKMNSNRKNHVNTNVSISLRLYSK